MVDLKINFFKNYFRYILCAKYKFTFRPIFHADNEQIKIMVTVSL